MGSDNKIDDSADNSIDENGVTNLNGGVSNGHLANGTVKTVEEIEAKSSTNGDVKAKEEHNVQISNDAYCEYLRETLQK